MASRASFPLGLLALLGSCSPPPAIILAVMEGGNIAFHLRERGPLMGKPFGYDDDSEPATNLIVTHENGKIVWQLGGPAPQQPGCDMNTAFPITYGEKRCGLITVTEPADLEHDVIYRTAIFEPLAEVSQQDFQTFPSAEGLFQLTASDVGNLKSP